MRTCAIEAAATPITPARTRPVARALSGAALVLAVLAGCAAIPDLEDGRKLIAQGRIEEGLAKLEKASRENPTHPQARNTYVSQREAIVGAYVREGNALRLAGDLEGAEARYQRALRLDTGSPLARAGLEAADRDRRLAARSREASQALKRGDTAAAERIARAVLAENSSQREARAVMRAIAEQQAQAQAAEPTLRVDLKRPITLEFRDAPIHSVFEVIARTTGINFVFDRDVRPDLRTTIFARNTNLEDVIKLLLVTNQLERKVINDNSLLIYPNTQVKQREYQELVVRSFYLANADAKQTAAMIRALVKTRDLFIDDKLNLVVMKDTRDAVRLAEQLVATQDLGEPEVMLELEVLEVASSLVQEFGIRYPEQINFGLLGTGTTQSVDSNGNVVTITETEGAPPALVPLRPREWRGFVNNPVLILNLRKIDGSAAVLANPRIRVKNRDKAKVHIGEKVPVVTTTSTANVGVSSSVSYLETGLKLDVEPNIYLEDEVAIKVQLEVSNILEQLNVSGTISYRLGTRNAATTLRLRDGETQVLAGLINSEDRRSTAKVPLLGDFPLLGRLFRNDSDQRGKTEIVLLITPHVVRNLARPDTVAAQFPAGAENSPGAPPLRVANTAPQSLGLQGTASAAPPPRVAAVTARPPGEAPIALVVGAPGQANIGQEYTVTLRFAPGLLRGATASVELSYDPAMLRPVGGDPKAADGGRVAVKVATQGIAGVEPPAAMARFRVVAKQRGSTEVLLDVSGTDEAGRPIEVRAPESLALEIVP
jgi:general secretion pathway protein D